MSFKTIIDNATGVVTQDGGQVTLPAATEQGQVLLANSAGSWTPYAWNPTFKNRIINGDMRVAQRGTAAVASVSDQTRYPVDRWYMQNSVASPALTGQQSSDAPPGFSNSLLLSTTTAINTSNAQQIIISQPIEGYNVSDLAFATPSAKQLTLSFWVKSSVTGTYGGAAALYPINNSAYGYVFTYTISSPNTWERKTVAIAGSQSLPIPNTANGVGMYISFDLGSGTNFNTTAGSWNQGDFKRTSACVKWANNANATFYLTGVQLEVGSVATPFEMRPQQVELALCQRYYQRNIAGTVSGSAFGVGTTTGSGNAIVYIKYAQPMRATPTVDTSSRSVPSTISIADGSGALRAVTALSTANYGDNSMSLNLTSTSLVGGRSAVLQQSAGVAAPYAFIELSAEL